MFFLYAVPAIIQKSFVVNGKVVSNHDLDQIKKVYKALNKAHMPVIDGQKPEHYFYRKIFFEYIEKLNPRAPLSISEEEFKNYLKFQLMQRNMSKEQFNDLLKQTGISFKEAKEYFIETLKWFRYVGMNYGGLIRPSDKAVDEFMKQINKQIQSGPSTFLDGYIVQVRKANESFIDDVNMNAMTNAKNKEDFLKIAKNYEMQTLTKVPLEAVTHPAIKQALDESFKTKKAVVLPIEADVFLVVYVADVQVVRQTINKEQAKQILVEKIMTEKCSGSTTGRIARQLNIKHD